MNIQSNPNRISSNPLRQGVKEYGEFKVVFNTPNGRVFSCCNAVAAGGKHGHYRDIPSRWSKSRRDHGVLTLRAV